MADFKANPSTLLKNELAKIHEIKKLLEDDGGLYDENGEIDAQLLLDTIEGETNMHEFILEIEEAIQEYESNALAVKSRIDTLQKRKNRLERSATTLRNIILSAMDKAGISKISSDCATITVRNKPRGLVINDEALIPSKYFKLEPKLDKKTLLEDLKENENIAGAALDNGGISLQIKRS